jgi:hypothetical protein
LWGAQVHPGAVKYLKRGEGQVEKQYRYNCGDLPVLYKSEEKGRYIYVMEGAVTAFSGADNGAYIGKESAGGDEIMVPPCIQVRVGHRSTCCDLVLAFRRHLCTPTLLACAGPHSPNQTSDVVRTSGAECCAWVVYMEGLDEG